MTSAVADSPELDSKEGFFRHFQDHVASIQKLIAGLPKTNVYGGERNAVIDLCLSEITKLSDAVKDASSYIPAYDQRTYSQAVKDLSDNLLDTRSSLAPRQKFSFKSARKNPSPNTNDEVAAKASSHQRPQLVNPEFNHSSREPVLSTTEDADIEDKVQTVINTKLRVRAQKDVRRPSFSTAKGISIFRQMNLHIMLPSEASHATSTGELSDVQHCVIDMSLPATSDHPFSSIGMRQVKNSLIVCGQVSGPVHVTDLKDTVLVTTCRQIRLHECINVDVYLQCSSRPIIEDCEKVRFAPLPKFYQKAEDQTNETKNQWDQVDDFKWLKAEQSPHWSILPEAEQVKDEIWKGWVSGDAGSSLDEILGTVKGR